MLLRRFFNVFLCLLLAVGSLSAVPGCSETPGAKKKRIIILTNAVSPFWDAADVGSQKAAEDLKLNEAGYIVVFEKNSKKTAGQLEKLREYAGADDIAAIAISVTDPKSAPLMKAMQELRDLGIKVITVDSDVDREKHRDKRFAYIGTDNVVAGRELGRCAKKLLPDGGEYVAFVGFKGQANAIERNQGFKEGAGDKFTQKDFMGDEVDDNRARTNVSTAIGNFKKLNLLVGIWSYNTPAIVQIVTSPELDARDRFTIVGFDAEPKAISAMAAGNVDALVVQNPYQMGYQSVKLLKALIDDDNDTIKKMFPNRESDKANGDIYNTGLKVVVPDEGSPLTKDLFEESTEFLKLSKFQEWLAKYKLTGS